MNRQLNPETEFKERIAMDEHGVIKDVIKGGGGEKITFSTHRFGEITVPTSRVLDFPGGLVGMPHSRSFVFLHQDEGPGPFFWMQSTEDPALAFVVTEPQTFFPDYVVQLSNEEQSSLGIQDEDEGLVCVILVVPDDPRRITANLRGPIVINSETNVGAQLVLSGEEFSSKAMLFSSPNAGEVKCSS